MAQNPKNPVRMVLARHCIVLNTIEDIKNLAMSIKLDVVMVWMLYEYKRGGGVVQTCGSKNNSFLSLDFIPYLEQLIDRFNLWADAQEEARCMNDPSRDDKRGAEFIKTAIDLGERLLRAYLKGRKLSTCND